MTLAFIDGLRGISILLVLWLHLSIHLLAPYSFAGSHEVFWTGSYGVRLFFIVSAFTLFRSHTRRSQVERRPVRNFYLRRAFRILPLYWGWVLLFGLWGPDSHDPRSVLATLFFYMMFFRGSPGYPETWRGAWSIYVEESFYALFPLFYRFVDTLPKAAFWAVASWGLASAWEASAAGLHLNSAGDFVSLFPLDNFFCFFLGIFFYHLESSGRLRWLDRLSWRWLRFADLVVLAFLVELMTLGHRQATLALGLVFLSSVSERTLFGKLTRSSVLRKFGVCCYSLYLMNQFVLPFLQGPLARASALLHLPRSNELLTLFWMAPFSALMLGLGILSFRYLETPSIEWGRRLIARGEARKALAPAV